jgi:signal transduction histidine kinase
MTLLPEFDAKPDARGLARYGLELLAVGLAYLILAKLGLSLASLHPSASPIWPPTGFALAVVLLRGLRVAPAIFLGAFIANATTAGSILTSAAIALGNTLECVIGGTLITRWSEGRNTFDTPTGVAKFALVSLGPATMTSATVGVASLALAGYADWASFANIWLTWWMGDVAGALVITPLIVLWAGSGVRTFERRDWLESGAVLAAACAVGLVAFSPLVVQNRSWLAFLAVAPLLWAGLRRGPRDTATVALILSSFAIWGTLAGGGPFARATLNESLLLLLMFMISTAVPSLALAADVAVRKRTEESLRRAREQLEQKVELGTLALGQASLALESEVEQRRRAEAESTRDGIERRKAQETLERTREQLAQAQKMEALGQLTGGIAHDFNNLLMIMGGYAQMLQRRLSEPKLLQAADAIRRAAARGENLTRQLLTFSRRQQPNPAVVNLSERIEAVRAMLGSSLREDITLACDVAPDVWPVEIDVAELELALVNIAVNARDAMPEGGTVTVSVANATVKPGSVGRVEGDFVAVAMSDTGAGIVPEVLPKVFEPFFTTKSAGKGTGLGLSQVYGFAHQSDGEVAIASEVGRGTTVTIYLPRSHARLSVSPEPSSAQAATSGEGTILVVEDNPHVADVTSDLLAHLGYRTLHADNAADALDTLEGSDEIGLVFSDIVMPGMNGIALAQEIAQRYPRLPVLLTSGFSDMIQAAETRFPILRKPFELPALDKAVREAMRKQVA